MSSDEEERSIESLIDDRVKIGTNLSKKLINFTSVEGVGKLDRRVQSELKFLQKLKESASPVKKEYVLSSNLGSLTAITNILTQCDKPIAVLKLVGGAGGIHRIEVDVVSDGGSVWHKAIARKAGALEDIWKGRTSCGQKSVIDQAKAYLLGANLHPHHFNPPRVIFYFSKSVSVSMARKLMKLGVEIEGKMVEMEESSEEESDDEFLSPDGNLRQHNQNSNINCDAVFLDITCMVAYVSSMTNGGANWTFPRVIYNQQADWERKDPAKPKLDALFQNKKLVTCREALSDFEMLIEKMGGMGEKGRARDLIQRLQIVPNSPSERVMNLQLSTNIKTRSRIIFGTADELRIVIVTANTGFIRSAAGQGTNIANHVHEPRVLTEQQEPFAVPYS
nr:EOG090X0CWG [Eurycercus lamellatus]